MHKLYILMRTDLDSLNPGKAMAQAAHAANLFEHDLKQRGNPGLSLAFQQWKGTLGFGTTLTLAVADEKELRETITHYRKFHSDTTLSNLVVDPTYPIRDGKTTHAIKLATCGYIFMPDDAKEAKKDLGKTLHP